MYYILKIGFTLRKCFPIIKEPHWEKHMDNINLQSDSFLNSVLNNANWGEAIFGLGNDIVKVKRISELLNRKKGSFLKRCFTSAEINECRNKINSSVHYAGKWAAKEAVYKALQLQWDRPFSWKEIEILSAGEGAPTVRLSSKICEKYSNVAIPRFFVSISHCEEYAFATVLALNKPGK